MSGGVRAQAHWEAIQVEIEEALDLDISARELNKRKSYEDAAFASQEAQRIGKLAAAKLERIASALRAGRWSVVRDILNDYPSTRSA